LKNQKLSPVILILTTRNLHTAPRVLREIQALASEYAITTVGHTPAESMGAVKFIEAKTIRQSLSERIVNIVSRILRINPPVIEALSLRLADIKDLIDKTRPVVIITHEPHFLPYLKKLKNICHFKIVYNAHEYHPLEFSDRWYWNTFWKPYYENIYINCLPDVDLFINVCESISKKCEEEFNKQSIVIPNASIYHEIVPRKNEGVVKIIHHGGCIPSRKIEVMIEVAKLLGQDFHLDLMLTLNEGVYFDEVKKLAEKADNVKIIEPVQFDQIIPFTNQYDIGLFLLPPTNYNYSVALPNKLFEFIQARLCIAIGPSPEMKNIVDKNNLGVVSADFTAESMAEVIRSLDRSEIQKFKERSHAAASKLSAENFNKLFVELINGI
jgi:hypothetical protein